jgi:cyclic-di-GMP phosphodiesterase TipF (flagellum assembly factor)
MSRSEADCLSRLAAAGFRFAMDSIADLRIDAKALAAKGFRFLRVPASTLLTEAPAGSEIHVADLSGLLSRFGIDLIADGVASETAVVDLLDFDLRLAQGPLFGALRPVRAELFGDEVQAPASTPENPTLGETALQGMIEKMRKAQEEKQAAAGQKPGSRSGWRALARQVGSSRERA